MIKLMLIYIIIIYLLKNKNYYRYIITNFLINKKYRYIITNFLINNNIYGI